MSASITEGQFATLTNGVRLHYASAGEVGRPLMLFVHGFPQAWFEWEAQLSEFGTDYFAVAPDLRGFNLSSKPSEVEFYKPRHIVDDLRLLIAQLGYSRATVVAHDWGGAIAWNLAIFAPQCVQKLIIVNAPHPYLFHRDLATNPAQQQASQYMNWLRRTGSEVALAKDDFRVLDRFFESAAKSAAWYTPQVRSRYHAMWSVAGHNQSHALTGGVNFYRASPLHPPQPGETLQAPAMAADHWMVRVPVRVVWGEADIALLPSLLDGLEELCADLIVERIPEGTHWIIHEQPALVNALLRRFAST